MAGKQIPFSKIISPGPSHVFTMRLLGDKPCTLQSPMADLSLYKHVRDKRGLPWRLL